MKRRAVDSSTALKHALLADYRARQARAARARRPNRKATSALKRAALEFFDDPDNRDLLCTDEYVFKDALVRFEDQELVARYPIESVRKRFSEARSELRRTKSRPT